MTPTANLNRSLPLIVQLLLPKGHLDTENVELLRAAQAKESVPLEEILIRKGFASERDIAAAYADYYLIPLFDPDKGKQVVDPDFARLFPERLCRDHLIAPVTLHDGILDVIFFTPNELLIVEELQLLTGLEIRPLFAPLSVVEGILGSLYDDSEWPDTEAGAGPASFEEVDDIEEEAADGTAEEVIHLDQPPPPGRDGRIIRFVNQIFEQAFRAGASDVHIEPFEDRFVLSVERSQ